KSRGLYAGVTWRLARGPPTEVLSRRTASDASRDVLALRATGWRWGGPAGVANQWVHRFRCTSRTHLNRSGRWTVEPFSTACVHGRGYEAQARALLRWWRDRPDQVR